MGQQLDNLTGPAAPKELTGGELLDPGWTSTSRPSRWPAGLEAMKIAEEAGSEPGAGRPSGAPAVTVP